MLELLSAPTSAQPRTMTRDILRLRRTCGLEPGVDGVRIAVVGSGRASRELDPGSWFEDEPSDARCVGHSLSLKQEWMTTTCILIIFVMQLERLISVDIVPHRNMVLCEMRAHSQVERKIFKKKILRCGTEQNDVRSTRCVQCRTDGSQTCW